MENDDSFALAEVFDRSDVAFCVIKILLDEAGKPYDWQFAYLNDALARIEGRKKEELVNKTFFSLFPNAEGKWFKYYYPAAYEGKDSSFEEKSEEIGAYLKIHCFPVKRGYCGCIIEDVTELHESYKRESESEAKLEVALKEAERANKAKTSFLSSVSHDLRAPINAINGYNWLALENIDNKDKVKAYLEKSTTSAKQMLSLIEDVLDITRIERGKMVLKKETCDLSVLLEEIISILKPEMEKKLLNFRYKKHNLTNTTVICDAGRIKQVLINVIGNAVKFTEEEGSISLDVFEQNDAYEFQIADNGMGMDEEFLNRIYLPFERADSSYDNGVKGMGLGMSITKKIVDAMGGTIDVSSELGKGSTFLIKIPMEQAKGAVREESSYSAEMLRDKKILLIENNEYNLDVASEFLQYIGADVHSVSSGEEAIQKLKESSKDAFDLLVLDFQLLGENSLETAMKVRWLKDELHLNLIIVAISAHALEEDKRRALESGVDVYLTKPLRIKQFCKELSGFM